MSADPVLAAWAETVNAARDGDPARIAAAEARWEAVTRDLPPTTHADDRAAEDIAQERADRRDLPSSVRAVAGAGFESNWRAAR